MRSFYEVLVEVRYEVSREVHGGGLCSVGTLGVRALETVAPGGRVKRFCGVSGEVEGRCVVGMLERDNCEASEA